MIVPYRFSLFRGALVARRILLCGLVAGAFFLTLAIYAWHDGLWHTDVAPATHAAPAHPEGPTVAVASPPAPPSSEAVTTPTVAAPPAAATNPPPAVAPPEPIQDEPQSAPPSDVNDEPRPRREERGGERGARTR
jgi:hypothetical protein